MNTIPLDKKLEKVLSRFSANPLVSELSVSVVNENLGLSYHHSSNRRFFAASVTKIVTSSTAIALDGLGVVYLDEPISKHLSSEEVSGLNTSRGNDYSNTLSLRHLLSQTSGIPDYYRLKKLDPKSDIPAVTAADKGWSFHETLKLSKKQTAKFAPGSGKAEYSFTNFQIVSEILERSSGEDLGTLFNRYVFAPAKMVDSNLFSSGLLEEFQSSAPILFGKQSYLGSRRMSSLRGEGALVSTSSDLIALLRFALGSSVSSLDSNELFSSGSTKIFPFIHYGLGVMRFRPPRFLFRGAARPDMVGHLGATGSFAFIDRTTQTYFSGTVNQLGDKGLGYKLLLELVKAMHSSKTM
jgi:D-alanyl-D-alanine carboxypeptidase